MKAHPSIRQSFFVKPTELFFGVLMLIIIFMTSCNAVEASPKVSLENTSIETTSIVSVERETSHRDHRLTIQQQQSNAPVLIIILLAISYSALSGGLYLVREIKK